MVESSPSKVLNDLIKSVQGLKGTVEKNKEEFSQKIESLEAKIKEHKLTIINLDAKEKARAIYQNISTSRLLFVVSLVYELEQSIHTFTETLPNKFCETSSQEYKTLVLNKNNKKKNITSYDVLALESDSASKLLLNSIQQNFDKEHETYERVDLVIVMLKLRELRQKRNKFFVHLFEEQKNESNLKVKVEILLDIEKALAEGNLSEELKEVDGFILIAINKEKADIEKTNNKTLEEILGR